MPALTEEQFEVRSSGIGSSEIATICGLNPYRSPVEVWLTKMGQREELDAETKARLELGHRVERVVLDMIRDNAWPGLDVENRMVTACEDTFRAPYAVATPDAFIVHNDLDTIVEIKNVGQHTAWHWGDAAPDYVLAQVQWQIGVGIASKCHVDKTAYIAALVCGTDARTYRVDFDEGMFRGMLAIATDWWRKYVETKTPPPPDGTDAYKEFVARRFPRDDGACVRATPELIAEATAYAKAQGVEKLAATEKQRAGNALKAALGDARCALWTGGKVSWGNTAKGRTLRVSIEKDGQ